MMSMTEMETLVDLNPLRRDVTKFNDPCYNDSLNGRALDIRVDIANQRSRAAYDARTENERHIGELGIVLDPGLHIKASLGDGTKVFVNICKSDAVAKPVIRKKLGDDGLSNMKWEVPNRLAMSQNCRVVKLVRTKIFEFTVHPDTYRMAETNSGFFTMICDIALDALRQNFGMQLDKSNLELCWTSHNGTPAEALGPTDSDETRTKFGAEKQRQAIDSKNRSAKNSKKLKKTKNGTKKNGKNDLIVPDYTIVYASDVDSKGGEMLYRDLDLRKQLIVKIDLPLLEASTPISVNIRERKLLLVTREPVKYKLEIELPELTDKNKKQVHFDCSTKKLTILLPVASDKSDCGFLDESRTNPSSCSSENEQSDTGMILNGRSSTEDVLPVMVSLSSEKVAGQHESVLWASQEICNSRPDANTAYQLPAFTSHLGATSLSFVFHVYNVKREMTSLSIVSPTSCQLKMGSVDADGRTAVYYSCCLKFAEGCQILQDACSIDISSQNVVLLLAKDPKSDGSWDKYSVGTAFDSMKNKEFVTCATLARDLDKLDMECNMLSTVGREDMITQPQELGLEVTDMDDDKLIVRLEGKDKSHVVDDGETLEASDIVVVHTKSCPRLHSILKQRTISESSDDGRRLSLSADRQTSTASDYASDTDDGGFDLQLSSSVPSGSLGYRQLKKSVSFNDRIDRAVFQANQSVSSMHAALKNRRRRARKRDQYLQQKAESARGPRRRCRSAGSISMEDSGDEHLCNVANAGAASGSAASELEHSDASEVEMTRSASLDDCSSGLESIQAGLDKSQSTVKLGMEPCKTVESLSAIGKNGAAVLENSAGVSSDAIISNGERTRIDQNNVDISETSNATTLKDEVVLSNYSGVANAKMTQSGRNAINSSGAFRTSVSGLYHRDYETLCDVDSTVCDKSATVCDVMSVDCTSEVKFLDHQLVNCAEGLHCDRAGSVACIKPTPQSTDLALDQPCRQGLAELPVPCVSLTVAATDASSSPGVDN